MSCTMQNEIHSTSTTLRESTDVTFPNFQNIEVERSLTTFGETTCQATLKKSSIDVTSTIFQNNRVENPSATLKNLTSCQAALQELSTDVILKSFPNNEVEEPIVDIANLEEVLSELQQALKEKKQLKEEVEQTKIVAEHMELKLKKANTVILKLNKSNIGLKKHIRKLMDQRKKFKEQIRTLGANENFCKILNDDQIVALNKKCTRGYRWTNNTIVKALKLKMSCGSSGYKELLNQNIPLPSERTLRRKLEHINFEPGISDEIFDVLQEQVSQFTDDRERDCMLAIDEMSITAGEQVDPFTKCSFGLSTLPDKLGTYI